MNTIFKFVISFLDIDGIEVTSIELLDKDTIKIICDDFYSILPEYVKQNYEYDESIDKTTLIWKYKELWVDKNLVTNTKLSQFIIEIMSILKNEPKNEYKFFIKQMEILDYLKKNNLVSGYRITKPEGELQKRIQKDLDWSEQDVEIALIFLCYFNIYQVDNNNIDNFETYYSLNTYSI